MCSYAACVTFNEFHYTDPGSSDQLDETEQDCSYNTYIQQSDLTLYVPLI